MFKEAIKFGLTSMSTLKNFGVKNAPVLLAVAGVGALGYAVVKAWQNSPKAKEAWEEAKAEATANGQNFGMKEAAKAIMKYVAPVAIATVIGVGCIAGSTKISLDRLAVMTAGYVAMRDKNEALKKFESKVTETLGEKKVEEIKDDILTDDLIIDPPPARTQQMMDDGKQWCCLRFGSFKEWIKSSRIEIERSIHDLDDEFKELNDSCENFLPVTRVMEVLNVDSVSQCAKDPDSLTDYIGWKLDPDNLGKRVSDYVKYSVGVAPNGDYCTVVDFICEIDEDNMRWLTSR